MIDDSQKVQTAPAPAQAESPVDALLSLGRMFERAIDREEERARARRRLVVESPEAQ